MRPGDIASVVESVRSGLVWLKACEDGTYTKSSPRTVVLFVCPATLRPGTVQPRIIGEPRIFCSHVQPTRAYRCLMSIFRRPIKPASPGRHETEESDSGQHTKLSEPEPIETLTDDGSTLACLASWPPIRGSYSRTAQKHHRGSAEESS